MDSKDCPVRFELKKVNIVGVWNWESKTDTCGICRSSLSDLCIECAGKFNGSDDKCNIVWGVCNHAYHLHCISGWIKNHSTCPLCTEPWEPEKIGEI